MHDRLFKAAQGITAPWSVTGVQIDEAAKVLTVAIDFAVGSRFAVENVPGEHPQSVDNYQRRRCFDNSPRATWLTGARQSSDPG